MKKYTTQIIVAVVVVAIFVVYIISQKGASSSNVATTDTTGTSTGSTSTSTTSATGTGTDTKGTNPLYKDGTYTGDVANAYFGNLQVQATISGGKLTNVDFLQTPNGNENSIRINSASSVTLRSEAIAAQSAQVNIVSGATQSSQAFIESLGNALNQAKSVQS